MTTTLILAAMVGTLVAQEKSEGFLAEPKSVNGRGVLVLHPWWGLNDDVRAFCKRLANEGYVVFAPDMFDHKLAKTVPEAEALMKVVDQSKATKSAADGAKYLVERTGKKIAVIGFSYGAYHALSLSNNDADLVTAVVVFYGTGENEFSKSKASYLGHFAEKDEFEPKASVDGLADALTKQGRPITIYTYPDTGHWFFEPSVTDAYKKDASDLAWQRTVEFLKESFSK